MNLLIQNRNGGDDTDRHPPLGNPYTTPQQRLWGLSIDPPR